LPKFRLREDRANRIEDGNYASERSIKHGVFCLIGDVRIAGRGV